MILLIPAFDIRLGTFGRARTVAESGLKMLHAMAQAEGRNTSSFRAALGVRGCANRKRHKKDVTVVALQHGRNHAP